MENPTRVSDIHMNRSSQRHVQPGYVCRYGIGVEWLQFRRF